MSSNTSSTIISSTTTTTLPVVKQDDKLVWQEFCARTIRILKDENKNCKINGSFGMKMASWMKKERSNYTTFTDEEIKERIPRWLLESKEVLPMKVVKPRKGKAAEEEKNTVSSVSSASSVISVASSKKPKAKAEPKEPKQQDKRVEDIQSILTAVRALKNISPSLALETAIISLQAFIDTH